MAHRGGHPHVHVIVNRVDAESGKAAELSKSKLRLSKWAEGYEQGQGWPGSGPRSVRTGSDCVRLPLGPVPVAMPERLGKPPSAFPPLDPDETGPGVWKDQHPIPAPLAGAVAAATAFCAIIRYPPR